ncbi:GNAT family N-acetyltransferase [Hahella ganghwensis]|uniref:GNAT family N-acetyltransferase n=1 Tax=Hahella ganghwensis TaxID=286420 RepID=UPI0003A8AA0C|nr:GNAT family N-acetyltransferase [Hahella ganghwensis]
MTLKYTKITTWQESEKELKDIRKKVFVEEQNVPEDLEWDEYDAQATHFLVRDMDGLCYGVARLIHDGKHKAKVGRFAVPQEFRGQGIAGSLLKFVIGYARSQGIIEVNLSAQCYIQSLYMQEGFEPVGEPYDEAGIPHIRMRLVLGTLKPETQNKLSEDETVCRVNSQEEYLKHLCALLRQAKHSVQILTYDLEKGTLDIPDVLDAISNLARKGRGTSIQVVLGDPRPAVTYSNQFLTLARRLTTSIDIKTLNAELSFPDQVFVLIDDHGVALRHSHDKWEGFCCYSDPGTVKRLKDEFQRLLNHSHVSQELRQFSL